MSPMRARFEAMLAKAREDLSRDSAFGQPEWIAAHARLLELLPGARAPIAAPHDMGPDTILQAAADAGAQTESVMIYNPWRADPAGRGDKPWEDYTNEEVYAATFGTHAPTPGPLWFIPHECYRDRGPCLVQGEGLRDFMISSSCDLRHDVLFIWCQAPHISVIHHEGAIFHIEVQEPAP